MEKMYECRKRIALDAVLVLLLYVYESHGVVTYK